MTYVILNDIPGYCTSKPKPEVILSVFLILNILNYLCVTFTFVTKMTKIKVFPRGLPQSFLEYTSVLAKRK